MYNGLARPADESMLARASGQRDSENIIVSAAHSPRRHKILGLPLWEWHRSHYFIIIISLFLLIYEQLLKYG